MKPKPKRMLTPNMNNEWEKMVAALILTSSFHQFLQYTRIRLANTPSAVLFIFEKDAACNVLINSNFLTANSFNVSTFPFYCTFLCVWHTTIKFYSLTDTTKHCTASVQHIPEHLLLADPSAVCIAYATDAKYIILCASTHCSSKDSKNVQAEKGHIINTVTS